MEKISGCFTSKGSMKIYIDSGDIEEIKKYLNWGICDGVTTNPSIMMKAGAKSMEQVKKMQIEIANLIHPRPLSVEVTSDDPKEMLKQAHDFITWAHNIMVKITITGRSGESMLPVIRQLASEGISVNVTAIMTQNQAMLATLALDRGAKESRIVAPFKHIVSIFGGRISEEHGVDISTQIIRNVRDWLDLFGYDVEIIVGSIRNPENIDSWATTGAHILTIPPDALAKALQSGRTKETVVQFIQDAQKALGALK